jgi:hypothetical protein
MSSIAISCVAACVVCFLALAWLVAKPLPQETPTHAFDRIEGLLAQNARHFPQLCQSLAGLDRRYVLLTASEPVARHWRHKRLQMLGLDYSNRITRLAELLANLSARSEANMARLTQTNAPGTGSPPAEIQPD